MHSYVFSTSVHTRAHAMQVSASCLRSLETRGLACAVDAVAMVNVCVEATDVLMTEARWTSLYLGDEAVAAGVGGPREGQRGHARGCPAALRKKEAAAARRQLERAALVVRLVCDVARHDRRCVEAGDGRGSVLDAGAAVLCLGMLGGVDSDAGADGVENMASRGFKSLARHLVCVYQSLCDIAPHEGGVDTRVHEDSRPHYGPEIVGREIEIYWTLERKWFRGVVDRYQGLEMCLCARKSFISPAPPLSSPAPLSCMHKNKDKLMHFCVRMCMYIFMYGWIDG